MRRQSRWFRRGARAVASLVTVGAIALAFENPCPAMSDMVMPGMRGASSAATSAHHDPCPPSHDGSPHAPMCCMGLCCCCGFLVLRAPAVDIASAPTALLPDAVLLPVQPPRLRRLPRILQFANGPPRPSAPLTRVTS